MGTKPRSNRGKRKLASLRRQIAKAEARLSRLHAAIKEARSDAGLAAFQVVRNENKALQETRLRSEQAASASQAALDLAVQAAQTDGLTGLRNRSFLRDQLTRDTDVAARCGQHVGVLLLDLDDFKQLNDRHGHGFGDLVLQRVASVLTATVRATDTVCRLGGDEFVVMASTATRQDVDELARKVTTALCEPFCVAGTMLSVSASVGFSVFPEDGQAEADLLRKADESMYRIKRSRSRA